MKTTKLLIIALVVGVITASSAFAGTRHWNHNGHYRNHSNVHFSFGLGYPYGYGYGYGYPYYGSYPYGYGYGYYGPRTTVYASSRINDDRTVAAVQRRLSQGGYYRGSVDGVIGPATRVAIRSFERNNGLPVDGEIDRQLLRTMGLS